MPRRNVRRVFGVCAALSFLVGIVPRWTAVRVELLREAALRSSQRQAADADLPSCPLPGPERDAFLAAMQTQGVRRPGVWVPLCREREYPVHQIIVVNASRQQLAACREAQPWRPGNVLCIVEEPLALFADAASLRTWARRVENGTVFLSTQPLAWREHLVLEHRLWAALLAFLAAVAGFAGRRARQAQQWRSAGRSEGDPVLPGRYEWLLHFIIGANFHALPGDLSEEYAQRIETDGWSSASADQWYRWQVIHSIGPLLCEQLLKHLDAVWRVRRG